MHPDAQPCWLVATTPSLGPPGQRAGSAAGPLERHRPAPRIASRLRLCRGFTLVELLVTVAIVATLLAILMPALAQVRTQTRRVVCRTTLRELGRFTTFFSADHRGELPRSSHSVYAGFPPPDYVATWKWDYAFARYITGQAVAPGTLGQERWQRLVAEYYRCPLDTAASASSGRLSYGYNHWFELTEGDLQLLEMFPGPSRTWRRRDDVARPYATVLFSERTPETAGPGGEDHMMAAYWTMGIIAADDIEVDRNRHRPQCAYLFLDGHVEDKGFDQTFNIDGGIDDWCPQTAQ